MLAEVAAADCGAKRENPACGDHAEAIAAPVALANLGRRNGNQLAADKPVPDPRRHRAADLNLEALSLVPPLWDASPIPSSHSESLPQNAVMQQNVRSWIASALEGSGWTPEEVWEGVQHGAFHLFMHDEGCMVGEFIVSPRAVGFNVFAAGGALRAIRELIPLAEDFARSRGATFAGCVGRKGWVRYLKRYGYAPEIAVQKEL